MKITKKIISKLLIFALTVMLTASVILISCGKSADKNTTRESANLANGNSAQNNADTTDVQPTKPALNLPDANYNGYEFRVYNITQADMWWVDTTIYAEKETGEGVNDAVYKRNRLVENMLGVQIKEILGGTPSNVTQTAIRSIKSGADDYDLVMIGLDESGIIHENLLVDYKKIPYLDLTQTWWDMDMLRDLSISGHNYFMTGDFSLMHYGDTCGIFFNKKLLSDLGLDSPYVIVGDGKWTFDKFNEMAKSASKDLDGDGKFTKADQYGLISFSWIYSNAFMGGADQQLITKDSNDMHTFNVGNEKYIETFQKLMGIMHGGDMLFDGGDGNSKLEPMFINNQGLFLTNTIHSAVSLRGMETDFGILPFPKYDENQNGYHTYVYPPPVMAVPVTSADLKRTGMIIEALCYESTDTVVKAYYDDLLKTKISRDDESEKMLDIIFRNRFYSIADTYYMSETFTGLYMFSQKEDAADNIVSWLEKNEGKITAAIDKNNQAFTK